MRRLREWVMRLGGLFNRQRKDRDLDEEIETHLQMHIEDKLRSGMTPEEARRQALIKLGGIESTKEAYRDQRGLPVLEALWQDIRYGARQLRKNAGFTTVAVLTLALGIGATTAVFSIVDGVLLKPLPYDQPGQLVQVWEASSPGKRISASPGAFLDWREQSTVFESLSLRQNTDMNLTGDGEPERVSGLQMSATGLQILRARPLLGRSFAADEDQPGKDKVVVLSHGFWRRRFGGKANIVGQVINLDDQSYTVIGVLPPSFLPWNKVEFVVPVAIAPKDANRRNAHWLEVIGRLKRGVSVEQAQTELSAVAARLRPIYPPEKKDWSVTIVPMREQITGEIKPTLLILAGAVGFFLIIACANLANLQLAKAFGRHQEIVIRAALGARRWRVVQQLLVESLLLSFLGAVLGLLLAFWSARGVAHFSAVNLPRAQEVSLDLRVLCFAFLASVFAGVVFGLVPALPTSRANLSDVLKNGERTSGSGPLNRVRKGLIAAEVALSLVLLIGAGLLLSSFVRLTNVPSGINPQNALIMQASLAETKYPDAGRRSAFFERIVERLKDLPGVEVAGVTGIPPLAGWSPGTDFTVIGRAGKSEAGIMADFDFCTSDYFRAVGIPLRKGRYFSERDRPGAPRVVIINEALAREHFANEEPLGKRIHLEVFTGKIDQGWEIVGVVGDVHQRGQAQAVRPCVYRPLAFSFGGGDGALVVRTKVAPLALAESVRKAILDIDANQPVANVRSLADLVADSVAQRKFILMVLGGFAGAAVFLAVIGIYGVIAYAVSQRSREIGIRMALGATRLKVLSLVMLQGMKVVALGLVLGVVGARAITHVLLDMLYQTKPDDPLIFIGVSILFVLVALVASWLPASRAAKVDPMIALHYE